MRASVELHQRVQDPEASHAHRQESTRSITCAVCEQPIAQERDAFAKSSPHAIQAFVNPHGFTFEVLTVKHAQSLYASAPSADFSWFPAYAWRVIVCSSCQAHLGWSFESSTEEPHIFFALIVAAINLR